MTKNFNSRDFDENISINDQDPDAVAEKFLSGRDRHVPEKMRLNRTKSREWKPNKPHERWTRTSH